MSNNRYAVGLIIVAAGIILLLGKLGVIEFLWSVFWPVLILIPGLILHALYFSRTLPSGVLVPGGILVTISVMFLLCTIFGWKLMAYLWPGFPLAVAIGLYEYYIFDRSSSRSVFVAALILAAVSAVLFGIVILSTGAIYVVALALIVAGALMIFGKRRSW
jgi:hypothetical protein